MCDIDTTSVPKPLVECSSALSEPNNTESQLKSDNTVGFGASSSETSHETSKTENKETARTNALERFGSNISQLLNKVYSRYRARQPGETIDSILSEFDSEMYNVSKSAISVLRESNSLTGSSSTVSNNASSSNESPQTNVSQKESSRVSADAVQDEKNVDSKPPLKQTCPFAYLWSKSASCKPDTSSTSCPLQSTTSSARENNSQSETMSKNTVQIENGHVFFITSDILDTDDINTFDDVQATSSNTTGGIRMANPNFGAPVVEYRQERQQQYEQSMNKLIRLSSELTLVTKELDRPAESFVFDLSDKKQGRQLWKDLTKTRTNLLDALLAYSTAAQRLAIA